MIEMSATSGCFARERKNILTFGGEKVAAARVVARPLSMESFCYKQRCFQEKNRHHPIIAGNCITKHTSNTTPAVDPQSKCFDDLPKTFSIIFVFHTVKRQAFIETDFPFQAKS